MTGAVPASSDRSSEARADLELEAMGNNDPRLGAMPADPRAAILATSDGGEHWQKQANPVTEQLSDIACVRQR